MANANTPRGLSPVGTISGAPFNQQGLLYAIATDGSNTYAVGDAVKVGTGADVNGVGYVTKAASTDTFLGVIVGFRVSDPGVSLVGTVIDNTKVYVPLSSGTRYAYVIVDPEQLYEIQGDATGVAAADIGKNAGMTITANQTTLSVSSPLSNAVINSSALIAPGTTGSLALPLQLIGLAQRPDNAPGAYAKVLVKLNKSQYGGQFGTA